MTEEEKVTRKDTGPSNRRYMFRDIPYSILDEDIFGISKDRSNNSRKSDFFMELGEIKNYYDAYEQGATFNADSTGDYVPSSLRFKKIRNLINTEARFMFCNPVDVNINKDDIEHKDQNAVIKKFIDKVLKKNNFFNKLLKAEKDCAIGKRIAILVNFSEDGKITISFLNSMEFYYELLGDEITKFVAFVIEVDSTNKLDKRIRKKSYRLEGDKCILTERLYDGVGNVIESPFEDYNTELEFIPAWIVFNDGLVNDTRGESQVAGSLDEESYYSKLANGDNDALRKSMNPIRFAIDASANSTSNLSTSPGAFWDIQSDENGVDQKKASVGQIESSMNYSAALTSTLERVESQMYEDYSIPNIASDKLKGVITSGKTLKALYWPLTVRATEKISSWIPAVEGVVSMIYYGSFEYGSSENYISDELPYVEELEVEVVANYALPEDEEEEKQIDLAEVTAQTMSKRSYMKKWRGLTDEEADEELKQIAAENELLQSASMTFGGVKDVSEEETSVEDMADKDKEEQEDSPEDSPEDAE